MIKMILNRLAELNVIEYHGILGYKDKLVGKSFGGYKVVGYFKPKNKRTDANFLVRLFRLHTRRYACTCIKTKEKVGLTKKALKELEREVRCEQG